MTEELVLVQWTYLNHYIKGYLARRISMNIGGQPSGPQELELFEAVRAFLTSSIANTGIFMVMSARLKKTGVVYIVTYVNTLKKKH